MCTVTYGRDSRDAIVRPTLRGRPRLTTDRHLRCRRASTGSPSAAAMRSSSLTCCPAHRIPTNAQMCPCCAVSALEHAFRGVAPPDCRIRNRPDNTLPFERQAPVNRTEASRCVACCCGHVFLDVAEADLGRAAQLGDLTPDSVGSGVGLRGEHWKEIW